MSEAVADGGVGPRFAGAEDAEQLSLLPAGRQRKKRKRAPKRKTLGRVPHRARPVHKGRYPVHVTLRARHGLPSFRQQLVHRLVADTIRGQRSKAYGRMFQIVEYSIQSNHLHFILEAADGPTLAAETRHKNPMRSGITGFLRVFVMRLNRLLGRTGSVFPHRYHRRDLFTPREVRLALRYVLLNHSKHARADAHDAAAACAADADTIDPHSSARTFTGWTTAPPPLDDPDLACRAPPRTWLLGKGWRWHGLIDPRDVPHS